MSEQFTTIKTLQFVLHWILIFYAKSEISESDCKEKCDLEVGFATSYGNGELFCNQECKLQQCNWGCVNYGAALNSSCQTACDEGWTMQHGAVTKTRSAQQTEREYCTQGCSTALNLYFNNISRSLGPLPAPELKTGFKSHSSVVLHWVGKIHPNVTYYIQKRVVDTHSNWQIYNSSRIDSNGDINITDLQPYVTYRFKILLVVTASRFLSTNESEPITTLPFGAPTLAPAIRDVSAPTPTVISVSWDPPTFTNGPLVGYHLTLTPINHPTLHPTNREVPGNMTSWTFRQLQSSQVYMLSVSAQNADGEGPPDTANITTPNPGNLSAEEMPYLILAADNKVLKQNMKALLTNDPDQLTNKSSSAQIKGIGVHISKQTLLVSDSTNRIHLVDVNRKEESRVVLSMLSEPTAISTDWLNDLSYVVDGKNIYQCNVTSNVCIKAVGPLPTVPRDIKIDPVNGYLYFTQGSDSVGIFRIDIGEITPTKPARYQQVIKCPLMTFSIDYGNIQLYFPNESQNTMQSAFLDGSGVVDLRKNNVVRPNFYNIISMVHYKGIFYWTNGSKVLKEDYDESNSTFYHNSIWFIGNRFSAFNIYQPSVQPKPVPHSSPQNLQALFTDYKVYIQWDPPKKLSYQGQGAWNKWSYEVSLFENDGTRNQFLDNVMTTSSEITNLEPNTEYLVKVRARSEVGVGPWSRVFLGRTLSEAASNATVVVASFADSRMILKEVDMFGKVMNHLYMGIEPVVDMTWTGDKIVVVLEDNFMYVLYMTSSFNRLWPFFRFTKAVSVAYDWLGKKLYWSDVKLGVIKRSDMEDENVEFVAQGLARHMAIDAVDGRLYWVTINTVESSFLNGENHIKYFSEPLFSGKQVISLTLNFDRRKILWYVRGFEQQELYMSDMIHGSANQEDIQVQMVGNFQSISDSSVLQYHAHRIFWQNSNGAVTVGDLEVNHTSVITNGDVSTFFVQHASMHPYPDGLNASATQVIPSKVPRNSIRCVGVWSRFNLTWGVATLSHGNVFYEVSVQVQDNPEQGLTMQTKNSWYEIGGILPYRLLIVTIRAYTYWGYGPITTAEVRSPMSVPSEPLTPRVYVTQRKDGTTAENSMAADFRWSSPDTSNGEIVRYIVSYWNSSKENMQLERTELPHTARHFILPCLKPNTTYNFQVQACTDVGCGNKSVTASARPNVMNPVPQLLLSTSQAIMLTEIDTVKNTSVTLDTVQSALAMTYLAQDNRRFWVNNKQELYESSKNGTRKLLALNDTVLDMAIDWISRTLYIVVRDNSDMTGQIIAYLIDQQIHQVIVSCPLPITGVAAEPYTSTIFWTERAAMSQINTVVQMSHKGTTKFFSAQRRKRDVTSDCNCSMNMQIGDVMSLDHSQDGETDLLLYDLSTRSIVSSDILGCHCKILVTLSSGNPPDLMTVDHLHVYWYIKGNNSLYALEKETGKINIHTIAEVLDMQAYGSHLQPLPSSNCLDPGAYNGSVTLVSRTNVSITVQLENMTWPSQCQNISHPATKYTVYYKETNKGDKCDPTGTDCLEQLSYSQLITLHNLDPFTEYTIQGAVSNYYTEYLSEALSPSNFYKTAVGVPSPVSNVEASVLTPNNVTVEWNPPLKPNGPTEELKYVVQYSTQTDNGVYQEGNINVSSSIAPFDYFSVLLSGLAAGHDYKIKVLVSNSDKKYYSESGVVEVRTYLTPGPIEFVNATNDSITVSWTSPSDNSIRNHRFKYRKLENGEVINDVTFPITFTKESTNYVNKISGLEPDTKYAFSLKVIQHNFESYDWPYDRQYVFKTQAFVPEAPGQPLVKKLKSTTGYEVVWEKPNDNGEVITNYILFYCHISHTMCSQAYNGSDARWLIDDNIVPPGHDYVFRVAAENAVGLGPYSSNSTVFKYLETQTNDDNIVVLAVSLSFLFVFIVVLIMIICYVLKRRNKRMHKPTQFIAVSRGPDMELATLRELPHTTVQQSNTLYAINIIPTDGDIAALPHFRRDQLMLTKFLGSGAFGEVFEGLAKNILSDSSGETKVAVKTLRKSASDHEKEEFLKEALLMSNFKHDHILRLLGVCLDNDPQFIILELMEGGDLLSFLRGCRPSMTTPAYLCLTDLIKVCVHVARGCKYLEEMHFVHRDLAARNCLVSTKNPSDMVVKIGDFGLARDIYKNDYYRKEGEGLLPVRWMSPESLVDGVFTTQSDIWAFGVLMWEVLTFGQQPYQARTNIEVLHFVRSGGNLDQPENCPEEIFSLMRKCWSPDPEDRPSFSLILKQLEEFHEKCVVLLQDYIMPIRTRPPQFNEDRFVRNSYLYGHFELPGKFNEVDTIPSYDVPKIVVQTVHEGPTKDNDQHVINDIPNTDQSIESNIPADGYNHVQQAKRTKRQKQEISSFGHDQCQKEPQNLYRKIQHATSFDSPEPRDACIVDTTCDYLNPKTQGTPTYIELINDPSDLIRSESLHGKLRKASQSSYHTSQSSRHSSCSSDIYSHPIGQNLRVNLPPLPVDQSVLYEQIHSTDSDNGRYMPYTVVTPSIPEDPNVLDNYDVVPGRFHEIKDSCVPEGYSVIRGPPRRLSDSASRQGYMVVTCPPKRHCLSTSSSDDAKMSIMSSNTTSASSVTSSETPCYMQYDPSNVNETDNKKFHGNRQPLGSSSSAEICLNYDRPVINRPYSSAEARLVYDGKSPDRKSMIHNLALTDSNYVDCNRNRSYIALSNQVNSNTPHAMDCAKTIEYWANKNNQFPIMPQDDYRDNVSSGSRQRSQVYPADGAPTRPGCGDIVQASLV